MPVDFDIEELFKEVGEIAQTLLNNKPVVIEISILTE